MVQIKLHPAVVISRIESPRSSADEPESASLTNPTGADIEVESYLPLSELEFPEHMLSFGLSMKILPRPVGWPRRPEGGFQNDAQGFNDE